MKTGIELIADERARQINTEGWNQEHDAAHQSGELIDAGISYGMAAAKQARGESSQEFLRSMEAAGMVPWPWESGWWKPSADPVRNLVKAGALIAAEIDRINREKTPNPDTMTATPDDTSQTNAPAGIVVSDACSARLFATHDIPTDRWQPMLTVAHQTIGFGPLCETEEEAHWWCDQMRAALGRAGCRVDFSCRWFENEDGNWDTDCGECFFFEMGGPKENRARWCHYCGRRIEPVGFFQQNETSPSSQQ